MAPVSMTLSDLEPRFQGQDITQCQKTRKWYKIELYLQVEYGLSNGAMFNDLERPVTQFPRSHALTLNSSQTATDTAIVTIEGK